MPPTSRRPDSLWRQVVLRVPPDAYPVVRLALDTFWRRNGHRPATDPVALGLMLEMLCADYVAGPDGPPEAACAGGDDPLEWVP